MGREGGERLIQMLVLSLHLAALPLLDECVAVRYDKTGTAKLIRSMAQMLFVWMRIICN